MTLTDLLEKLEYLAGNYLKKDRTIDRNVSYDCLQQAAEELVSDSSVGVKSRMQGLMSCLAVFSRMRLSDNNRDMESADKAIRYLFLECAKLLLGVEFANAKPNDLTVNVFRNITNSCLKQHASDTTCYRWFELLKMVTENPWNSELLLSIIRGDELTDDCVAEYINEVEHPELILLRIEFLLGNNCADMAVRLIDRFTQVKSDDVDLMSRLLILLHNAEQFDEFHRLCTNMSCCMACDILRHVHETERMYSQQAVVLMMSCTFFLLDWVKITDLTCTRVLLRYWLTLERRHLAENEKEFLVSVNKVLSLAHSSTQLITFIDVMESLFGSLYLAPCLDVALQVLRSERHRLDCAQLYLKDRMEMKNASELLASVCCILARYFSSHLQMKMACLISAACISPSNEHFVSVHEFFKSTSELVSLQPVAPPGVEWTSYVTLWDAVKYLQPPWFHSCTDWEEINLMLKSHFRRAGWRYDSLAMAFKYNNHNNRGIGSALVHKSLGENITVAPPVKSEPANPEYTRPGTTSSPRKTPATNRKCFGTCRKKTAIVSTLPIVKTGDVRHPQKEKADTLKKYMKSVLPGNPSGKVSCKVSGKGTVDFNQGNRQRKEAVMRKQSSDDVSWHKRKLPSAFKSENVKKFQKKEDRKVSLDATKNCLKKQKRIANGKMKLKNSDDEVTFKVASSTDALRFDYYNDRSVAASPTLSCDSQATILLDNCSSGLCDSLLSSSDNTLITDSVNCVRYRTTEDEDTVSGNYDDILDAENDDINSSGKAIEPNEAKQDFHSIPERQDFLQNSDAWMFQDGSSEFVKSAATLETGDNLRGHVDCISSEFAQNGNGFYLSNSVSHSQDKIPSEDTDATDVDENTLSYHRSKINEDKNCERTGFFANHEIIFQKEDDMLGGCNELANLVSAVSSCEVSTVENNQTPSCDHSTNLPSVNRFPTHKLVRADNATRKATLKCSHCSSVYCSDLNLRRHLSRVHKVGFECPVCQKFVSSRWGREIHMARMHGSEIRNRYHSKNTTEFKCQICLKSIPSAIGQRLHMARIHSFYIADIQDELNLNHTEVNNGKDKAVLSDRKISSPRPGTQKSLFAGVTNYSRPNSKFVQKCKTNHKFGNNLFELESLHRHHSRNKKLVTWKGSKVDGLKGSRNELSSYSDLCPKLQSESCMVRDGELLTEVNSAEKSDYVDASELLCSAEESKSSEDTLLPDSSVSEPKHSLLELSSNPHMIDTPVCDQRAVQNGWAVGSSLHLKNCCVRLQRLRLSKIKLRECHVIVERLSLEEIADGSKFLHLDCSVNCRAPLKQQKRQNDVSVEEQSTCSFMEVPQLSKTLTTRELSDEQTTIQNDPVNNVLSSEMSTTDVCRPNSCYKTNPDALQNSLAAGPHFTFPRSSSSSLCTFSQVPCCSSPTISSDGQPFSKRDSAVGTSVIDGLPSAGSFVGTKAQTISENSCCVEQSYESSPSTEMESELSNTSKESGKTLFYQPLSDFSSGWQVNSEKKSSSSDLSSVAGHLTVDCNKVSRRKLLLKRRRTCSTMEEMGEKSQMPKISDLQSSDKQRDRCSSLDNEGANIVDMLKGKTCQVKLVPLGVSGLDVSNRSNLDSSSPDAVSKVGLPERRIVPRNLFESFQENLIRSDATKKSCGDCSQQSNGLSKLLVDSFSKNYKKPCITQMTSERIPRQKSLQNLWKSLTTKVLSISPEDKLMLTAPLTSADSKNSHLCNGTVKQPRPGSAERIERVAVPVCFSDSLPVVDQQLTVATGYANNISEAGTSNAASGLVDCEDVCVISSDEEVQVIDLDEVNSCASSDAEVSCNRQELASRTKNTVLANRQRKHAKVGSSRVRHNSLASDTVLPQCDLYCCELCPKSFTDRELLMKHKSGAHRRVSSGDKRHPDLNSLCSYEHQHTKLSESLRHSLTEHMQRSVETKSSVGGLSFYSSRATLRHSKPKTSGAGTDNQVCLPKNTCVNEKKKGSNFPVAERCYVAKTQGISSVRSLSGTKPKCMVESRNILVVSQM